MDKFDYSKDFQEEIHGITVALQGFPNSQSWLEQLLGGPKSRFVWCVNCLCPEIEYHCGSLIDKRVLDFGCGTGPTTAALAHFCKNVSAFDIDASVIGVCRKRVKEHGLESRVKFYIADDIDTVRASLDTFDIIVLNGVIEHIPLSQTNLRKRIMLSLFEILDKSGYLYITDTPNRLLPFDFHTTQLWLIPWTKPGSEWAYKRAVRKGRHWDNPVSIKGPLGLEEMGAWGATYWEILGYLKGEKFVVLNTLPGHNRHLYYKSPQIWWRSLFEFAMYYSVVKIFQIPMNAFAQSIPNLIIKKI